MDKCSIKGCRNPVEIGYYQHGICEKHWLWHCDDNKKFNIKDVLRCVEPKKVKTKKKAKVEDPPKKKQCPKCKDYTIDEVEDGVKCSRCDYAQYICRCKRRFKKRFALTNHKKHCKK